MNLLKEYIDDNLPSNKVIVLGDLNDDIAESTQNNVFQNVLDNTENYYFADYNIANESSVNWSYPTWPSHLDHILITNELFDELDNSEVLVVSSIFFNILNTTINSFLSYNSVIFSNT